MIKVFVGTENNQYLPQKVLEYSIKKNTNRPVEVHFIKQNAKRVGGTNFGFVRFTVPKLCNFEGKAIYLDADQLVLKDIGELYDSLDPNYSIALVKQPEGFFGKKVVARHNQTSVMVLDCEKLKSWDPDTMFDNVIPNRQEIKGDQIHYRNFMKLDWFDQSQIQEIDPKWNHFNIVDDSTKLVHFSHVRSQPWKNTTHKLTTYWSKWLRDALKEKHVSRLEILKELFKGHIDRSFYRYLFA